jgi:hypothetical protein
MPILTIIRDETVFSPEEVEILVSAFDSTLQQAGLVDREDPMTLMVAQEIIAIARDGERDPERLCARTLAVLGLERYVDAA